MAKSWCQMFYTCIKHMMTDEHFLFEGWIMSNDLKYERNEFIHSCLPIIYRRQVHSDAICTDVAGYVITSVKNPEIESSRKN
jgi:hypothetical protein